MVSDIKGRLTLFTNLGDEENVQMRITETDATKIKNVTSSPDLTFFTTIGDNHLSLWNSEDFTLVDEADQEGDMMVKAVPEQQYALNQRILDCCIGVLKEKTLTKKKKVRKQKEKKPKVAEESKVDVNKVNRKTKKQIKKQKHASKDDRKILQRQKKQL